MSNTTVTTPTNRKRKRSGANQGKQQHPSKKPKHTGKRRRHERRIQYKKRRYQRGSRVRTDTITDKKLQTELQHLEDLNRKATDSAARAEILLPDNVGYLESEDALLKTWKFDQNQIKTAVDVQSSAKIFNLEFDNAGSYMNKYSGNGKFLLMGSERGHVAMIDWIDSKVKTELNLGETVRDVSFLHNETLFAVAQKRFTYMYDKQGIELQELKTHLFAWKLEYLPYHFLLCSVGKLGILKYQDTTTGQLMAQHKTKLGACRVMTQNPNNAVIHLGHQNGTVTLWNPNMSRPLVKMLCHRGQVNDIAINRDGTIMATAGNDGKLKIWDLRTYNELQFYYTPKPVQSIDISQRGLLSIGFGPHVQIWKDYSSTKAEEPYMIHQLPKGTIKNVQFCPYEDILGIGHSKGFSSIMVPGSGEPNFDTFEQNPFQTKQQRREASVKKQLEKIPADMITLDNDFVGNVTRSAREVYMNDLQTEYEANNPGKKYQPKASKRKARGRGKIGKVVKTKENKRMEERNNLRKEQLRKLKEDREKAIDNPIAPTALSRFSK
eukprot:TRINITY_DN4070_c0_g1_i1.p1 TRINITY_DN4070_c0_g1~~TRINITY_DN4070_c0_g1_i1.p1  ORF type:complete len:550 (+),score=114.53 TRINITY_DN4070_c0_g1_i1:228-1877(+)